MTQEEAVRDLLDTEDEEKIHKWLERLKKKECGHCAHWLKPTCEQEQKYGYLVCMQSPICEDYQVRDWILKEIQLISLSLRS